MQIGDRVRVLYPFTSAFPDEYIIEDVKLDGICVICGDRDFSQIYLETV